MDNCHQLSLNWAPFRGKYIPRSSLDNTHIQSREHLQVVITLMQDVPATKKFPEQLTIRSYCVLFAHRTCLCTVHIVFTLW